MARLYLSADRKVSANDLLIAEAISSGVPRAPAGAHQIIGEGVLAGLEGTYYLILVADATRMVDESNEKNNISIQRYDFPCAPRPFDTICAPR